MKFATVLFLLMALHFSSSQVIKMPLSKIDENVKYRWCGQFAKLLDNVCKKLNFPPRTIESHNGKIYSPWGVTKSVLGPGIVTECCYKACSLRYVKDNYCAEPKSA